MDRLLASDGAHASPCEDFGPESLNSNLADVAQYVVKMLFIAVHARVDMDGQKGFGLAGHARERCHAAAEASRVG